MFSERSSPGYRISIKFEGKVKIEKEAIINSIHEKISSSLSSLQNAYQIEDVVFSKIDPKGNTGKILISTQMDIANTALLALMINSINSIGLNEIKLSLIRIDNSLIHTTSIHAKNSDFAESIESKLHRISIAQQIKRILPTRKNIFAESSSKFIFIIAMLIISIAPFALLQRSSSMNELMTIFFFILTSGIIWNIVIHHKAKSIDSKIT